VYAPVSGCGRGCLPRATPRVGWPVRAVRLGAVVGVVAAGVPLALLQPVLTAGGRARSVRVWFRAILRAAGVRLVVRGSLDGAAALVAANHVSWLDVPAVLAVEPMRVVAKSEVRRWPVIGLLAARGGTLFIDRARLRRLPGTVADIAGALRSGHSVLVFPEGTTRCGRTRGRVFPATFQAAVNAGARVRAVSLRYRLADGSPTTVAAFLGDDTLPASMLRIVATRGLTVELDVRADLSGVDGTRRALATATEAALHGSTKRQAPGRTVQLRRRIGPEISPSALT